jgi:hypothetical protein
VAEAAGASAFVGEGVGVGASGARNGREEVRKEKGTRVQRIWAVVKKEALHYWHGTRLLGKEIRISSRSMNGMRIKTENGIRRRRSVVVRLSCSELVTRRSPLLARDSVARQRDPDLVEAPSEADCREEAHPSRQKFHERDEDKDGERDKTEEVGGSTLEL